MGGRIVTGFHDKQLFSPSVIEVGSVDGRIDLEILRIAKKIDVDFAR